MPEEIGNPDLEKSQYSEEETNIVFGIIDFHLRI